MRKLIALALPGLLSGPLMAAGCATSIEASDAMQFSQKTSTKEHAGPGPVNFPSR